MSRPAILLAAAMAAGVLTAAGMVGWRLTAPEPPVPPDTPLTEQCAEVPSGAERITLTAADGAVLGGALLGPREAEVGVVLRQGASQRICEWLPWAGALVERTGARVLLFDRRGRGSSPAADGLVAEPGDTVLAVRRLRQSGQRRVALVASSMGNSVMFATLPLLPEPPCAVISVSPVLTAADASGVVDGGRLRSLPANLWVTWEQGNPGIAAEAGRIVAAARSQQLPAPRQLAVDTDQHSRQLVLNHREVQDFLVEGVGSCAG